MAIKYKGIICFMLCLPIIYAIPVGTDNDMIVTTDVPSRSKVTTSDTKEGTEDSAPIIPKIYEMSIKSNVSNRFAQTNITSKVKNIGKKSQEATFFVVLPDSAYISGFTMEIGGKNYTAYVAKKEEAKRTYDEAVQAGYGAAHVAVSARDSNKFTVSMNIEPESKAIFYLTYEELLQRKDGFYELIINIHPKQLVKDLKVEVDIDESKPLKFVKAPPLRSGNEIGKEKDELDPRATIQKNDNQATVKFSPDFERQKQIAHNLGTKEEEGIAGQFVVQYDVERDSTGGQILLKDGYFVHFFAPSDLEPLPKHVVFVLDTSGSMYEPKLEQLKLAMRSILGELTPNDTFNLVEFNSNVKVWNLDAPSESTEFPQGNDYWNSNDFHNITGISFAPAYPVNPKTLEKANKAIKEMFATGGTNIYEALRVGIHLVKLSKQKSAYKEKQPLIVFLTDGDPTVGRTAPDHIIAGVSEENVVKIPIFSLSFGNGADRNFLQKISSRNYGFSRHIYEDSDATLQLENFYKEISSPLLHDIKFEYTPDTASLTKTEFPIYFHGSEHVVAGKIPELGFKDELPKVICYGSGGLTTFKPTVVRNVGQLERLWAYMTVQKYLAAKELAENGTVYDQKATDVALKYSFVTPVTSLVVVKPNATAAVDTEAADKGGGPAPFPAASGFGGISANIGYSGLQSSIGAAGPSGGGAAGFGGVGAPAPGAGLQYDLPRPISSNHSYRKKVSGITTMSKMSGGHKMHLLSAAPKSGHKLQSLLIALPQGAPSPGLKRNRGRSRSRSSTAGVPMQIAAYQPISFQAPSYSTPLSSSVDRFSSVSVDSFDMDSDAMMPESAVYSEESITEVITTTTTLVPVTLPPAFKEKLPWLDTALNTDGTLNFLKGKYTLGFNETTPAGLECTDPKSEIGACSLVKDCEVLHPVLTGIEIFKDYFCAIDNKFAGVCCPLKK